MVPAAGRRRRRRGDYKLRPELILTIERLHRYAGWSYRRLAEEFQLSRGTIVKAVRVARGGREAAPSL